MISWGTYFLVLLTLLIWNAFFRMYMMNRIHRLYSYLNEEYKARKELEKEVAILNAKISCLILHQGNGKK